MTRTAPVPPPLGRARSPNGPVPSRAKRIIEFLRLEKEDLLVDLYCRDLVSIRARPEQIRPRAHFDLVLGTKPETLES